MARGIPNRLCSMNQDNKVFGSPTSSPANMFLLSRAVPCGLGELAVSDHTKR